MATEFTFQYVNLNAGAGTADVFSVWKAHPIMIKSVTVRCPDAAPGGTLASIAIHTNCTTPHYFITALQGNVVNLTAEATLTWEGSHIMEGVAGDGIQITRIGAAGAEYNIIVSVTYKILADAAALEVV